MRVQKVPFTDACLAGISFIPTIFSFNEKVSQHHFLRDFLVTSRFFGDVQNSPKFSLVTRLRLRTRVKENHHTRKKNQGLDTRAARVFAHASLSA